MSANPPLQPHSESLEQLKLFLPALRAGSDHLVVEVRALNIPDRKHGCTHSGFFDLARADLLWNAIQPLLLAVPQSQPQGIYLTINGVHPDLLARAHGRLKNAWRGSLCAKDEDISHRRRLLIDVDPVCRTGISATDSEKAEARCLIEGVRQDLASRGWPPPLFIDSGNGFHLWYPLDLPTDDSELVKQLLHALARRHDTSAARIDTSVFNPSRIAKLPGTWSRKGDPLPDRPHRLCRVVAVPDEYRVVRKEQLAAIVAEYPLTASRTLPCATTKATDPGEKSKRSDGTRREDRCVVLCRAYLAKLPPAVAGKHGSDRTFEAARIIWNDFAIDEAEGWPLLCEWNRKCLPPWPEEGGSQCLRRKWNEAVAKGGDQRGCKVRGSDSTRSDSSAEARDQSPTGQPQAGAGIILDYFRDTYGPVFRRGNAVHCHDGRDVPMSEACTVANSRLIESLMAATDAPRLRNGDIHRQAIPAFFRTWSKVAWGDLLAALPDEDDAVIGNDAPACEEFRRLVREALFSEVVLGDTLTQATELTRTERRSLIDWCNKFAKTGPWRDIRSKRCWCRCLEKPGGELKLQVAIRHEIFAQLKADRRLSEMGSKKFTRRAARYGVGTSTPTFRPHGFNAIVLDQDFIDDLICGLPNENEPLES